MELLPFISRELIFKIGYGVVLFALLHDKIPILNKISIQVKGSENLMRHFRWILPLLVIYQTQLTIESKRELNTLKEQVQILSKELRDKPWQPAH